MLEISLEQAQYVCNHPSDLVLRLNNTSAGLLTNIILRIALPTELLLLGGGDRFEIARLPAGDTAMRTLRILPRQAGCWAITSPNCSYRDALGYSYRINDLQLPVQVVLAPAPTNYQRTFAAQPSIDTIKQWRQQFSANTRLIDRHRRRLQKLKEQRAIFGLMTDPQISIEIEDIERQIDQLEAENSQLRTKLGE